MSDQAGDFELDSSDRLGADGTTYPATFAQGNRGLEGSPDGYTLGGNSITVSMRVTEPGDWIRVVTRHVEGVPTVSGWGMVILPLLLVVGLTIHIAWRRRVRA